MHHYNLGQILPSIVPPLELHSDPERQRPVSPELAVHPSLGKVTMENKLRRQIISPTLVRAATPYFKIRSSRVILRWMEGEIIEKTINQNMMLDRSVSD